VTAPFERSTGDGYRVSTDRSLLDLDAIHAVLRDSYWSAGIPRAVMEASIAHSIPFGLYAPDGSQAGFCRVLTDTALFAYLADVIVMAGHQGRGLGVFLVECALAHPDVQGVRRFHLGTLDAHGLYERFGFVTDAQEGIQMDRIIPVADLWRGAEPGSG
jgi:GNAT superfamily N-acetyltransferase